ncbi:barstar family protein [Oerskovia sp. M15]
MSFDDFISMDEPWLRLVDRWVAPRSLVPDGLVLVEVHGDRVRSKSELLEEVARAFKFPDYFGHNWDAVADCLGDLEWLGEISSILVVVTDVSRMEECCARDLGVLLEIFKESAEIWRDIGVVFVVVIAQEAHLGA